MTKRILIIILITIIGGKSYCQLTAQSYKLFGYRDPLSKVVKVALIGDEKYDNAIKASMEKYWKVSKFEFIDYKTLSDDHRKNAMLKDSNNVFLLPLVFDPDEFQNYIANFLPLKTKRFLNFNIWMAMIEGENLQPENSIHHFGLTHNFAFAPFDCWGYEADITNIAYRMDLVIKSMNDVIEIARDKHLKEDYQKGIKEIVEMYNKKAKTLKGKTLLVNEKVVTEKNNDKKITLKPDVLAAYKGPYQVVSPEEIEKKIKSREPGYAFLCPAINNAKDLFVYDLETMEVVFAIHDRKGLTIDKSDISELNSAVNGTK